MSPDTSPTSYTPKRYIELPVNEDDTITIYELTDWGGDYYVEGPVNRGYFLDKSAAEQAIVAAKRKWKERNSDDKYGFHVSAEEVRVQVYWSEAVVNKLARDVVF